MLAVMSALSVWAIVGLIGAGLLLIVLEIFVPSGGMIGVLGAVCVVGGLLAAFLQSAILGFGLLIAVMILLPILVTWAVKYFPKSRLSRGIVLRDPEAGESRAKTRLDLAKAEDRSSLVGVRGKVVRDLRPSGVADLNGLRIEVVSEGTFVEAGHPIEVVRIDGRTIVVAAVEEGGRAS
ncbi:MAG: hypothetical protein BIFFINMI_03386 [Phycisphaerae bacterium]|nr:hypothetical protein [Phycisphaerae bacterium]